MPKADLRACPKTKLLIFMPFCSRLDRRISLFQVSGTAETGSAARQGPSFSSGWSYRTGSKLRDARVARSGFPHTDPLRQVGAAARARAAANSPATADPSQACAEAVVDH